MEPTPTLKPCPFCGGEMHFRKALWPSDGNVDAVIHAGPSDCGMIDFCTNTTDGSVIAAWNKRASHAQLVAALRDLIAAFDKGALEMNSPEICGDSEAGIPTYRWHEEWLHYARAALATAEEQ